MKLIHCIVTFSVASTAWAHPQLLNASTAQGHPRYPMGFFAKVGNYHVPLKGASTESNGTRFDLLLHGAEMIIPTEFKFEDGYAVTMDSSSPGQKQYLGISDSSLGYDSGTNKVKLVLDKEMKISNKKFKSCVYIKNLSFSIKENEAIVPEGECVEVDIYFWPYDTNISLPQVEIIKKKGKPVKNEKRELLPEPVDNPNVSGLELGFKYQYSTSLAFFAKINGDYIPLSGTLFKDHNFNVTLLSHDVINFSPVVFYLDGRKTETYHYYTPGYLGIHRGMLAYSPKVSAVDWYISNDHKVLNDDFFSCNIYNSKVRAILTIYSPIPHSNCFRVEIYLSPYDKSTGTVDKEAKFKINKLPTQRLSTQRLSTQRLSTQRLSTQKLCKTEKNSPYSFPMVFFIKFNGYTVPLSNRYLGHTFKGVSRLTHGKFDKPPVEFCLQDKKAITNSMSVRFLGFDNLMLSFGPSINPFHLDLNSDGKVKGSFHSCENRGSELRDIAIGEWFAGPQSTCFEVDLYFLPYNEMTMSQVKFPVEYN